MSALALIIADFCDWLADDIDRRRLNGRAPDTAPPPRSCRCVDVVGRNGSLAGVRAHHSRDYRCGAGCCV